jgi:hypothetical protein
MHLGLKLHLPTDKYGRSTSNRRISITALPWSEVDSARCASGRLKGVAITRVDVLDSSGKFMFWMKCFYYGGRMSDNLLCITAGRRTAIWQQVRKHLCLETAHADLSRTGRKVRHVLNTCRSICTSPNNISTSHMLTTVCSRAMSFGQ